MTGRGVAAGSLEASPAATATADRTRSFMKDVKRIIIKVGTAVVTRHDGRLALGRLGALCEQVKELNTLGYEVILITSCAVGVGRQGLKYQKLVNGSFADLQKPQMELDGKAFPAVGQRGLMALYNMLFTQLDVSSSQLLVTDSDFENPNFRESLRETVESLLDLKVIPVFNENDAVSTRKAPYEGSSGIFWDNDSLAGLLAIELKVDLLVLLSDVDGLYNGPPSDPQSKIIHTYIKEKHHNEITFGDKSCVGRGDMTAKVKAAIVASTSGTPVVITRFASQRIINVLHGEKIGTLFHKDASLWEPSKDVTACDMAVAARECSRRLQNLSSDERKKILLDVADALEANEDLIRTENEADVAAAQDAGYEKSLVARLTMKPRKIASLVKSIRTRANMEDPINQILKRMEVAENLVLEKMSYRLGVLLIVCESRPDALVQIASLAIRSGNGFLLKGGKEAMRSNAILHKVITGAIPDNVGEKLIGLVTSRDEVADLLKLDDVIDLVIPRGSNKLVSQIKASTKIPVLGHADGICHVYIYKSADMDMAKRIVMDTKIDYPAACNATMETLLVHKDLMKAPGLDDMLLSLKTEEKYAALQVFLFMVGLSRMKPWALEALGIPKANSFHHEYSSMACTVEFVDVQAAIDHIHRYGSAHTDCIVTTDDKAAQAFLCQVDRYKFDNERITKEDTRMSLEEQYEFAEEDLWPLPLEKKKEDILLFVMNYKPGEEELCFVRRLLMKASGKPTKIITKLSEMSGSKQREEIELHEVCRNFYKSYSSSKSPGFSPMEACSISWIISIQSLAIQRRNMRPKLLARSPCLLNKFREEHAHPPLMQIAAEKDPELPREILMDVFALLEIPDLLRAGSVCSSWNSIYTSLRNIGYYKKPQTPCLLYTSESTGDNVACLYSLAEKRVYKLTLPEPPIHRRYLIGSSHGWLVTVDEQSEMHLVNPITSEQIALPSVTTIEQVTPIYDNGGAICKYHYSIHPRHSAPEESITLAPGELRCYFHHKAFIFYDTSVGSYIVVFIHNPFGQLLYARLGDEKWTRLSSHPRVQDCIYKDGLLYAVTSFGEIIAFNLSGSEVRTEIIMDRVKNHYGSVRVYIVQAPWGDLLQVWRPNVWIKEEDANQHSATFENKTKRMKIYKVCTVTKKLVQIYSLDDHVLFLGNNQSLCSRAEEYPQLKPNHVYFTDDVEGVAFSCERGNRLNIGVLNFGNKSMEEIIFPRPWSNCLSPLLIIPNPTKMD